jgi:hypothetical protein
VWKRICKKPLVVAFEHWQGWVEWDVESARVAAVAGMQHEWGVKLLVSLLRKAHLAVVRQCFSLWRGAAADACRHDVIVQRIIRRWQLLGVASCMCEWKVFTARRQRSRRLAGRVFRRLVSGKVAGAWSSWLDAVRERQRHDVIASRVLGRLRRSAVQRAYLRWLEHTAERRRMKYLVRCSFFGFQTLAAQCGLVVFVGCTLCSLLVVRLFGCFRFLACGFV